MCQMCKFAAATRSMSRQSNVSTVLCVGVVKKWRGALIGCDVAKLRGELEASRDYVFEKAGFAHDLFGV